MDDPYPLIDSSLISEADWFEANRDHRYYLFLGQYGTDDNTWSWLFRNVPPLTWEGTQLQYAYCEMPVGLFTRKAGHFF